MDKRKFIKKLEEELNFYRVMDVDNTIAYYDELIDDRLEAGESETTIFTSLETPNQIAMRLALIERPGGQKKRSPALTALIVVLLILGSPLWGSLALTAAILIATGYLLIWLVPALAGIFFASFVLGGAVSLILSPVVMVNQEFVIGLMQFGMGFVMIGVGLLCGVMTRFTAKYLIAYSVNLTRWIGQLLRRKIGSAA